MPLSKWLDELDRLHDAYLETGSEWYVILWVEIQLAGPPSF